MKRMTTRVYGKSSLVKEMSIFDIKEAVDRLAAYEDTGLEPEEIAKIREDVENGYLKSTARRYGISVDRLREFAEADREGRCVVLPRLEPGRGDPAGELGEPGPPGVPWSPGRHKTYNELIKWLRTASGSPGGVKMSNAAADALEELQAELEKVKVERDAAIKDLNEFLAMDELCPIQCEWCKWNGTYCDGKTPEWRGIKKED